MTSGNATDCPVLEYLVPCKYIKIPTERGNSVLERYLLALKQIHTCIYVLHVCIRAIIWSMLVWALVNDRVTYYDGWELDNA